MNEYIYITGAAGGIGKAMIEVLSAKGYNLIVQDLKASDLFSNCIIDIKNKYSVKIIDVYYDITDYEQVRKNVIELHSRNIKVQHLINCAGIAHGGLFQMTPLSEIKKVFEINLFGQMNVTQNVLKLMKGVKNASIVNFCSIAGIDLNAGNSGYGVSKAAMIAWTKTLSKELAPNIRVNGVAPGLIDTNMAKQMENKAGSDMVRASLMNRLGDPTEIAFVVSFLISEEASFVNGQIIRIDGGDR